MQIVLVESEIHEAIQLYLQSVVNVATGSNVEVDLKATRGEVGMQAFVSLTPAKVSQPSKAAPTPAPVATPAPTVAVGEPAPGLETSEAAPAEVEAEAPAPASVQATPVAIADPSQVKPRTPRTPAEVEQFMKDNPVEEDDIPSTDESTPVLANEDIETDQTQAEETAAENAEVQVPNAVEPVQVVEESVVTEAAPVSESVPQPVTDVVPVAEPTASTQVEDLAPKVAEVEVNGELQTEVVHSDPALPTGVPAPEVVSIPADAVVANKEEIVTETVAAPESPLSVQNHATDAEGQPVRRSLFRRD